MRSIGGGAEIKSVPENGRRLTHAAGSAAITREHKQWAARGHVRNGRSTEAKRFQYLLANIPYLTSNHRYLLELYEPAIRTIYAQKGRALSRFPSPPTANPYFRLP